MADEVDSQKRALRAELRERRRLRTSTERAADAAGITQHLIDLASDLHARTVAAYLSLPDEPGTRDFVTWAAENGIRVLLPISRDDGLLDWTVGEDEIETLGMHGTPEAAGELLGPMAINDVDLIIVPAAAIDSTGMRLGWGRGYFDKTLGSMGKCPPVYAVVFDSEFVEHVPREVHDQAVNGVVTPTRIIAF